MKEEINEIKIHEATKPESEGDGHDFVIEKSPELEKLSSDIKGLKDAVDHDKPVTVDKLLKIESSLNDLMIDVGGEKVSIRELRNSENARIWKEIEKGKYSNCRKITKATPQIIQILIEHQDEMGPGEFNLNNLSAVSDMMAEYLAKYKRELSLDGVTSISVSTAERLAKHKSTLILGITSISEDVAEQLAMHSGDVLGLSKLTSVSDDVAEKLATYKGLLFLDGLTSISDSVAERLAAKGGGSLHLEGIKSLSDSAAERLAKHDGDLFLWRLTSISDEAAKSLAKHKKSLYIIDKNVSRQIERYK